MWVRPCWYTCGGGCDTLQLGMWVRVRVRVRVGVRVGVRVSVRVSVGDRVRVNPHRQGCPLKI